MYYVVNGVNVPKTLPIGAYWNMDKVKRGNSCHGEIPVTFGGKRSVLEKTKLSSCGAVHVAA